MKKTISILFFLLCSKLIVAQNIYLGKTYLVSYWQDGVSILKKPLHVKTSEVAYSVAFVATGALVMANDANIKNWFQQNRNSTTNQAAKGFQIIGNGSYCFPAMGALYLGGLIFKQPKIQYTGLQAFKSLVIAGGITEVIKIVAERERPVQNNNPYLFHGIDKPSVYNSFPSGHTCDAFAMASVISSNVKNKWWNIPIYAIATGVGLSRINDDKHWASDVMMGAAIGYGVGKIISHSGNFPFQKAEQKITPTKF